MREFLIALLVLLWFILGWLYYNDYQNCCNQATSDPNANQAKPSGPILFNWNDQRTLLGEGWPKMKDSLALFASDSTSLEIVGFYCVSPSPGEADSIGLARARSTRMLFENIPDAQVILLSKGVDCDSINRTTSFESVSFSRRINTKVVKEIDDRTLIYFPFNSTKKLNNSEVEAYLDKVAERVNQTGESVRLTGHTDAIGSDNSNLILGQKRADIVKAYLVEKGVKSDKIIAESKGESEHIAGNDTESDRAKNRRTELKIFK